MILKSPENFPQADYILLESTYGNSLHDEAIYHTRSVAQWIKKPACRKKANSSCLLSVWAVRRKFYFPQPAGTGKQVTPTGLFCRQPAKPRGTEVVKRYPDYFNQTIQKILKKDKDPFSFPGLKFINIVEQSKLLNSRNEPCVIISASGMAEAGRVKHHISNNIENSRNTILMTGYCEPNSLGGRLIAGAKEVSIFGVLHEVHAEIGAIRSMSAHGDYEDLCQWLACQDPRGVKKIFLVHGEYEVQEAFKQRLMKKGFVDVEIPARHAEFGLG